ncbi:carboxymuconolactone decarboxylase family protein [Levilactobacillus yiduensis]|uniref:carboxymuconolactone decarboxylase family protein n=1 Tax=Levilactobacillus yiduensis TaxID=2953880 RepID=UPI000EF2C3F8|nr:carboxymuconolactone decarboxylase family protein [Levilactobacillus yiduensis]AYM01570.1 hypothetical protein D8911_00645 [Levilactobacillus brevis]
MTENEHLLATYFSDDPDLAQIVNRLMTAIDAAPAAIAPGEASLIAIITLTVQHTPAMLPQHVIAAQRQGISAQTILEALYQLVPVIGFPLVINSVQYIHAAAVALA